MRRELQTVNSVWFTSVGILLDYDCGNGAFSIAAKQAGFTCLGTEYAQTPWKTPARMLVMILKRGQSGALKFTGYIDQRTDNVRSIGKHDERHESCAGQPGLARLREIAVILNVPREPVAMRIIGMPSR